MARTGHLFLSLQNTRYVDARQIRKLLGGRQDPRPAHRPGMMLHHRQLWGALACGEVAGTPTSLGVFDLAAASTLRGAIASRRDTA